MIGAFEVGAASISGRDEMLREFNLCSSQIFKKKTSVVGNWYMQTAWDDDDGGWLEVVGRRDSVECETRLFDCM